MPGDYFFSKIRDRFSATGVDTDGGGVTVTQAAAPGFKYSVSGIQCSGDKAAIVSIESPANTILWRKRFAAAFVMSETFGPGGIVGASSAAVLVKINDGTANTEANIQGYKIPA